MAAQVARVKARTRPWRSIIALALALCGLAAGEYGRYGHQGEPVKTLLQYPGAAVFLALGLVAAFGLSGQARDLLRPVIGAAHAGVARYGLVLASIFAVLVVTLNIADVPVGQLVLGGAVTGVLLGIAAQQSLSNLFAGMVLLFARPFHVGDRVRFRAGALYGLLDGTVTDISITYVRLETAEGLVFVPNSQALAACVGPLPPPEPGPEPPAAAAALIPRDAAAAAAGSSDGSMTSGGARD
jgi:small-conductance mechanosensitive channel